MFLHEVWLFRWGFWEISKVDKQLHLKTSLDLLSNSKLENLKVVNHPFKKVRKLWKTFFSESLGQNYPNISKHTMSVHCSWCWLATYNLENRHTVFWLNTSEDPMCQIRPYVPDLDPMCQITILIFQNTVCLFSAIGGDLQPAPLKTDTVFWLNTSDHQYLSPSTFLIRTPSSLLEGLPGLFPVPG